MADRTVQRFVRGDEFGNDPLRHVIYRDLSRISNYTEHTVAPEEAGNPALLAEDYYGNPDMDFVILAYNGIGDGMSLYPGQVLRIPSSSQVEGIVQQRESTRPTRVRI